MTVLTSELANTRALTARAATRREVAQNCGVVFLSAVKQQGCGIIAVPYKRCNARVLRVAAATLTASAAAACCSTASAQAAW
jgi:hypothetical protein